MPEVPETDMAPVADEAAEADAPAPAAEPAAVEASDEDAAPEAQTFDADYVRELREEAKKNRLRAKELATEAKRAKELEAELAKIKQSQMTEQERKDAEAQAALARAEELATQLEAERAARQSEATDNALLAAMSRPDAGVVDPGAALKLIDRSELEYGDDGKPTKASVAEAISGLLEAYPFMKATRRASVGEPANPNRTTTAPPESDAARRRRIMRDHGVSPFDAAAALNHGGGVVYPDKPLEFGPGTE